MTRATKDELLLIVKQKLQLKKSEDKNIWIRFKFKSLVIEVNNYRSETRNEEDVIFYKETNINGEKRLIKMFEETKELYWFDK